MGKQKKVKGVQGLYWYEGKHGKIYLSRIKHEGEPYKKHHGWGISLTIAKEKHYAFVSTVNKGEYKKKSKKILFEKFVEIYIEYQKEHKKSWSRDVTSTNVLEMFFKGKYLHNIHPLMIERYRKARLTGEIVVKKEKVTKATINRERSCLSRMFSLADDWGYLDVNPIKKVKRYQEPLKKVKPLTIEQENQLLDSWGKVQKAKHAVLIFLCALYGGMRLNEVMQLRTDNVNFQDGTIEIEVTKSGNPKLIYMNATLTELLKEAIKEDNYFHSAESDFIFVNPKTGKPYISIRTTLNKAFARVGLGSHVFHDTRHWFCSRSKELGIDDTTVMRMGGWKTRSMVDRYTDYSDEHMSKAMEKLDEAVPISVPLLFGGNSTGGKDSISSENKIAI